MVSKLVKGVEKYFTYMSSDPCFDGTNTDNAVPNLDVYIITEDLLDRLIDYTVMADWGKVYSL